MIRDPNEHFERAHGLLGKAKDYNLTPVENPPLTLTLIALTEAVLSVAAELHQMNSRAETRDGLQPMSAFDVLKPLVRDARFGESDERIYP